MTNTHNVIHLNALELHLSHERVRLANAKTIGERAMRKVWVAQLQKEIANEKLFLAHADAEKLQTALDKISDDELLALLSE